MSILESDYETLKEFYNSICIPEQVEFEELHEDMLLYMYKSAPYARFKFTKAISNLKKAVKDSAKEFWLLDKIFR